MLQLSVPSIGAHKLTIGFLINSLAEVLAEWCVQNHVYENCDIHMLEIVGKCECNFI